MRQSTGNGLGEMNDFNALYEDGREKLDGQYVATTGLLMVSRGAGELGM